MATAIATRVTEPSPLACIDQATRAIAEASTVPDVVDIRDRVRVLEDLLRTRGASFQECQRLTELRLRAEYKAGQMLRSMRIQGGSNRRISVLAELGITRFNSMQWQVMAAIPPEKFGQWLFDEQRDGNELSTKSCVIFARQFKPSKRKTPTRTPAFGDPAKPNTVQMAIDILARLLLDVKRSVSGRPHSPITSTRVLRAADALDCLRQVVRQRQTAKRPDLEAGK